VKYGGKYAGKWGYIDASGKEIIPPRFDYTEWFAEGLAWVKVDNREGYVDKAGKVSLLPEGCHGRQFSCGLATVECAGGTGYVNHELEFKIEPQYDHAMTFNDSCLAKVVSGDDHFFIRTDGTPVFHREAAGFSENRAWFEQDGKFGFIDTSGSVVIAPRFEEVYFFQQDRAPAKLNGLWGFIDSAGKVVVAPVYQEVGRFSNRNVSMRMRQVVFAFTEQPKKSSPDFWAMTGSERAEG